MNETIDEPILILNNDVLFEIALNADQYTFIAIAATTRVIRTRLLKWYNGLPIEKLAAVHNIFTNIFPKSIVRYYDPKFTTILIAQNDAKVFLRGLRDTDHGCWTVIKDQLQFIENHQLVKTHVRTYVKTGANNSVDKIYTIFRCAMCKKLTSNAMYHPWIIWKLDSVEPLQHPNDITIETTMCCHRCAREMDVWWRGTLLDYIKKNAITNVMINHHIHEHHGHCIYRLRYQEYNDNMILNDAEVYAQVIIESGVASITRNQDV